MFRSFRSIVRGLATAVGLAAMCHAASASDVGTLKLMPAETVPGAIVMQWDGGIARPMADVIRAAFKDHLGRGSRVVFRINSDGGSVAEGERVIDVLREIRRTHRLETVVERGSRCGSMCVFVYLQGEHRVAALSSLWLFHEVSLHDPNTRQITRLDRPAWERLVATYFGPAGVSEEWTERMKPRTVKSDFWQTGSDLANEGAGIFHAVLGNQRERLIAEREQPKALPVPPPRVAERAPSPPSLTPEPAQPMAISWETKACLELDGDRGIYVSAPCKR